MLGEKNHEWRQKGRTAWKQQNKSYGKREEGKDNPEGRRDRRCQDKEENGRRTRDIKREVFV